MSFLMNFLGKYVVGEVAVKGFLHLCVSTVFWIKRGFKKGIYIYNTCLIEVYFWII